MINLVVANIVSSVLTHLPSHTQFTVSDIHVEVIPGSSRYEATVQATHPLFTVDAAVLVWSTPENTVVTNHLQCHHAPGASPLTHLYPILGAGFSAAPRDCLAAGAVGRGGEWE